MEMIVLAAAAAWVATGAAAEQAETAAKHGKKAPAQRGMVSNSTSGPALVVPMATVGYQPPYTVPAGTPIKLKLIQDLTLAPERLRAGDRVHVTVAEPVRLHPHLRDSGVIVPAGTPALGEIVHIGRVKAGEIAIRLLHVNLYRLEVPLRGQASGKLHAGRIVDGFTADDIVPPQPLVPIIVPLTSRARIEATMHAVPKSPARPPIPAPTAIVDASRPRAEPSSYVSDADYPESALRAGEEGNVGFTVEIGANGRVSNCQITMSSGSSALDAATCRIIRARARYTPAKDNDGNPAVSRLNQHLAWRLPAAR